MFWTDNIIITTIMNSHNKTDEEISAIIKEAIEGQFKEYNNEYCENLFLLFSNSMFESLNRMKYLRDVDDDLKNELDTFYHTCNDHYRDEHFQWPWKELVNFNRRFRKNQEENKKSEEQINAEAKEHLMCFHNI